MQQQNYTENTYHQQGMVSMFQFDSSNTSPLRGLLWFFPWHTIAFFLRIQIFFISTIFTERHIDKSPTFQLLELFKTQ